LLYERYQISGTARADDQDRHVFPDKTARGQMQQAYDLWQVEFNGAQCAPYKCFLTPKSRQKWYDDVNVSAINK
jgi:hypothetical protein